ncbi:MAG: hypothetical protein IT349_07355 [Candidatus Eisenbacteria bacterium]|nr:hypothetical protein [Candidatus Eisenbacteria bacterium]
MNKDRETSQRMAADLLGFEREQAAFAGREAERSFVRSQLENLVESIGRMESDVAGKATVTSEARYRLAMSRAEILNAIRLLDRDANSRGERQLRVFAEALERCPGIAPEGDCR